MTSKENRIATINGLREIAYRLEQNETLPIPCFGLAVTFVESKTQLKDYLKMWGGEWTKQADSQSFEMIRRFSDSVLLMLYIVREKVCKRIVVGTKEVPETIIPARAAETIPAHTEEVVEWACPDSLMDNGQQDNSQQDTVL